MRQRSLGPIVLLAVTISATAFAQTSTTYSASPPDGSGSVNSVAAATMLFQGGGSAYVAPALTYCTMTPQDCTFDHGSLSYILPNHTSATFTNLKGVLKYVTGVTNNLTFRVEGTASGKDNTGASVTITHVEYTFHAQCKVTGRSTSCTKTYLGGELIPTAN